MAFCDPKMTGCCPIRAQVICDELVWDKAIFLQQLAHQFERRPLVPPGLHQHSPLDTLPRTMIDGVRVRCSTVEVSPTRWKAKFGRMDVYEARKLEGIATRMPSPLAN